MVTTKIYKNTTDKPVDVTGVGEIAPGEHVSVTSEYHQPVILANFPGVVDATDEDLVSESSDETPVDSEDEETE